MGKLIIEAGNENKDALIKDYINARDRQAEIELEFCKRNATCIKCVLFNHCVTAGLAPNGIRK